MGNLLNEILYVLGPFKKRVKYFELGKNYQMKVLYPKITKEDRLDLFKKPTEAIQKNPKIKTQPIFDDSTGQPIYFGLEGGQETIEIQKGGITSEQDSITLANATERGRQLERYYSSQEIRRDMWVLWLIILCTLAVIINIALTWGVMTSMPGTA